MRLATFEKPFLGICRFFDSVSIKLLQMLGLYFQSREARNIFVQALRAPTSTYEPGCSVLLNLGTKCLVKVSLLSTRQRSNLMTRAHKYWLSRWHVREIKYGQSFQ